MKHIQLEAWTRETSGTSGATAVRNEGCIPAILVGRKEPPMPVKVKVGDMTRVLKEGGPNALVDLNVDGQSSFAMLKEFTRHPVSRRIIHADFQRVSATETIEAAVSLAFVGQPAEVYQSYTVDHELNAIHVKALPDSLPSHINVDVSSMVANHPLHAGDIPLPEGVELMTDPAQTVAVLVPPKVQAAEEGEEAAAAETTETAEAAVPAE